MHKDTLFETPITKKFEFDRTVASVFDDMIGRSVPHYREIVDLATDVALAYLSANARVYDLGCSTATTLLELARKAPFPLELIGIDNSEAMLEQARRKAEAFDTPITLINGDVTSLAIDNAQVIISLFTLQFIRPMERQKVIDAVWHALRPGGIFLFAEKVITENKRLDTLMIELYHTFKHHQGYSRTQIMQKREALENVLVPYTVRENETMVRNAGFSAFETLLKFNNFALFVAVKE